MVHLRIKVGLVGIFSCVVLVLSLQEFVGVNLIEYSAQLAVGVTLIAIGIGYWTFKPQIEELTSKIRKQEKDEKHKQDILTTFQIPVFTYFPEYEQSGDGKINWADQDMYQYCLSHLKSYPDLWNSFDNTKKYSEKIIQQVTTKIQEARNLVENTLASFKDLPESDTYLGYTKPYFMKKRFEDTLFKNIASAILNNTTQVRPFEILHQQNVPFAVLTDRSAECAIGDENMLKKLLEMIKPMETDSKLYSLIKEIEDLKKSVSWDKWTEFNNKRSVLVLDLTRGQKDLKGRCDYCP